MSFKIKSIALICGGIEDGKDGVGDYCRRLAIEHVSQGISCYLLALNDRYVDAITETVISENGCSIFSVRIPQSFSSFDRYINAAAILKKWQPDLVNLQFVCYGFNRRGLVWRELLWVPLLLAPYRRVLMMHELWIGIGACRPLKTFILGNIQRLIVLALIRRIKPFALYTTNAFYQATLARCKLTSKVLPLFGSIPVASVSAAWLAQEIYQKCDIDICFERDDFWIFGVFGEISRSWPASEIFEKIATLSDDNQKSPLIIFFGRSDHVSEFLSSWKIKFQKITFLSIGERPKNEISELFNSINFGLTSYPYEFLGKSSAAVAMLEHGVPIICSYGDYKLKIGWFCKTFEELIIAGDDPNFEYRLVNKTLSRVRVTDALSQTTKMYISDLDALVSIDNNEFTS